MRDLIRKIQDVINIVNDEKNAAKNNYNDTISKELADGIVAGLNIAIDELKLLMDSIILNKQDDKIVRKQVSITNDELEVLEDWEELPDNTYEDAIVNGIIRQIKHKKKEK